jgi:signal transduction histidine kinase
MHNPNAYDHDAHPGDAIELQAEAPAIVTVEIAHKFRELLTIALFSLEQLERQSLDDRGREQLQRVERAVGHIGEIIDRVQPI